MLIDNQLVLELENDLPIKYTLLTFNSSVYGCLTAPFSTWNAYKSRTIAGYIQRRVNTAELSIQLAEVNY